MKEKLLIKALKEEIRQRGYKQKKIAEVCGLSPQNIANMFALQRHLRATEYVEICTFLQIDPIELFEKARRYEK